MSVDDTSFLFGLMVGFGIAVLLRLLFFNPRTTINIIRDGEAGR